MREYELLENPDTLKKSLRRLRDQTNKLMKVRDHMVKALGVETFVPTDLDRIVEELNDIEFNLESILYGEKK